MRARRQLFSFFAPPRLSTLPPDFRHVSAISTHDLAAFSARLARLLWTEFVGSPGAVRRSSPLACDFTLLRRIH
jgi:hypothetical protein